MLQCSPLLCAVRPGEDMVQRGVCSRLGLLLLLLVAAPAAASSDLLDNQLGDINYCKKQCQKSIKNQDSALNACHRGCRLFSICQFVNGNADFNTSTEECHGACQEAYSHLLEQKACSTGCLSQPSEPEIKRRKLKAMAHRPKPVSVMDAMTSWCNDLVSSAQSFISSTWTFYLQADDGKVVVFQSQPEIEYSLPELQAPRWPPVNSHTERPHTGGRINSDKKSEAETAAKSKHTSQLDEPTVEHDFLGCMSRRSGLPRWILATCLFLSIMVMLWLSCASLVTAPDQHIKNQLSINGDKEYLDEVQKVRPYQLTPVIAVSVGQSGEEKEAGPLPVKVDLNKTSV
ncbi:transmembrane protein 59-like [Denticeps clupeoides]|nr:transmembrane protein 59-like [Denticeps clupeoides]